MRNNFGDIKIRLARKNDSKDVFDWRNDELTRQMSHNSEITEWENHKEWFMNSLELKDRLLLVCEDSLNNKISIIRFDISELNAVISVNLNPTQRSKNLAKPCLIKSIDFFSDKYSEINKLFAEIKEDNIASQKTFISVGFKKFNVENNIGFFQKSLI